MTDKFTSFSLNKSFVNWKVVCVNIKVSTSDFVTSICLWMMGVSHPNLRLLVQFPLRLLLLVDTKLVMSAVPHKVSGNLSSWLTYEFHYTSLIVTW